MTMLDRLLHHKYEVVNYKAAWWRRSGCSSPRTSTERSLTSLILVVIPFDQWHFGVAYKHTNETKAMLMQVEFYLNVATKATKGRNLNCRQRDLARGYESYITKEGVKQYWELIRDIVTSVDEDGSRIPVRRSFSIAEMLER